MYFTNYRIQIDRSELVCTARGTRHAVLRQVHLSPTTNMKYILTYHLEVFSDVTHRIECGGIKHSTMFQDRQSTYE